MQAIFDICWYPTVVDQALYRGTFFYKTLARRVKPGQLQFGLSACGEQRNRAFAAKHQER